MRILIEGSIEGTYSLSLVNRLFGKALISLGHEVYFIEPDAKKKDLIWLQSYEPELFERYLERHEILDYRFDIHSKNHYPLTSGNLVGRLNAIHCFGWEESILPEHLAFEMEGFDLLTFMSTFSLASAQNCGVTPRKIVIGLGLDHLPKPNVLPERLNRQKGKPFTFLHISSGLKRKGMEKGLRAFVEEFDSDDVRLIIKTYPNVTNEIPKLIKALQGNPILDRIEIDERLLSAQEITSMIDEADAMYLPSLGEGFLLPAAEAMLRGTITVTSTCGGNTDFCNEDTCILIPTSPKQNQSHVGRRSALWFESEVEHLRSALRRAVDMPEITRRRMINAACEHVKEFTWARTATSFVAAAQYALAGSQCAFRNAPEAVILLSTFEQRCGIATYSEQLVSAFLAKGIECVVYSEDIDNYLPHELERVKLHRLWRRTKESLLEAVKSLCFHHPMQPVIVQFHPAIIPWSVLPEICSLLKYAGHEVFVEVHSIVGIERPEDVPMIFKHVDHVIVHNDIDYLFLGEAGISRVLSLFIHPVPKFGMGEVVSAVPSRPKLATFGLCGRHKRLEIVLKIVDELRARGRVVGAEIISSVDITDVDSIRYAHDLYQLRRLLGLQDEVSLTTSFLPMRTIESILKSSSLAIFPYSDVAEGASGAVRVALGSGIPLLTSTSPIFDDLHSLHCRHSFEDIAQITGKIEDYLFNETTRITVLCRQSKFAENASWSNHVTRLMDLLTER